MEVFAKLGIDWKLLIAQGVNFLVLLWVLKRYAYGPILRALEARTRRIEQGLKDADAAQAKLASAAEREKEELAAAREAAREIVSHAEQSAKERSVAMLAETKEKIDRMIAAADVHLSERQAKLLLDAKAEMSELVLLATRQVLGEHMSAEVDRELVQRAVAALSNKK